MKSSIRKWFWLVVAAVAGTSQAVTVDQLRCEYRVNPLGIDETRPRLSWVLDSGRQTAYQVVVDGAWDSGKVTSDRSAGVEYAGKPLLSGTRCSWKVRVWDENDKPSAWSRPAFWTMGLLSPEDWKAEWIGYDKARDVEAPAADLDGAKWIWHASDGSPAPQGRRLFVTEFTVPADMTLDVAKLSCTADNAAKIVVNSKQVGTVKAWEQPMQLDVRGRLKPGRNQLRVEVENAEPSPAGLILKLAIVGPDGKRLTVVTDDSWKSSAQPGADWNSRELAVSDWPAARVLGDYGMQPWGRLKTSGTLLPPPAIVRGSFQAEKKVARAMLFATGLGIFDLYLNGQRVSDEFFTPGWTDYRKRVYYRTYDVTERVQRGENVLSAVVADGWFSGYVGYGRQRDHYGKHPRVRAQLQLEYADGTTATVATGPGWKAATGSLQMADFLQGEICDARVEPKVWNAVSIGCSEVSPVVQASPGPPVHAVSEFKALSITEPRPGAYVLNLGQNFAGVARLTVRGEPGQEITLRYAERLNPDGTIYTINLRSARATDKYICKGGGVETWTPRFTFHGYQYIEITGLTEKPTPDTVVGIALSSDTPVAGTFECSDPMLNKLHSNIYWTQRANFIDIPTDCPQRDERLGWTGDAQVYVRTATLNCDVQAFFTKWLVDLCQDSQRKDGQFPMVAPVKVAGDDGGPAWQDAGVICPWTIYEVYDDHRVLERHYDAMVRFIEFCRNRSTPELLPPPKFHCFGDWLNINDDTPKDVIYTAYFAYSSRLVGKAAAVLGKPEDALKYEALYNRIKAAFNKAYVGPDGRIKGNSQTAYVLALAFDLVDGENAKRAAQFLVENIEKRGTHLSTGFIGTKDLMLVLAKIGRNDVAYKLIHNDTFPSWGFSIKHGATSIWERWNGWTPEQGFGDPGMNSFAHYSFGAVYQWMVENIGGIRAEAPGYKKIRIQPQVGDLVWAKVGFDSVHGRIESHWKRDGKQLSLEVSIPANTTATVCLPGQSPREVGPGKHQVTATIP